MCVTKKYIISFFLKIRQKNTNQYVYTTQIVCSSTYKPVFRSSEIFC